MNYLRAREFVDFNRNWSSHDARVDSLIQRFTNPRRFYKLKATNNPFIQPTSIRHRELDITPYYQYELSVPVFFTEIHINERDQPRAEKIRNIKNAVNFLYNNAYEAYMEQQGGLNNQILVNLENLLQSFIEARNAILYYYANINMSTFTLEEKNNSSDIYYKLSTLKWILNELINENWDTNNLPFY